MACVAMLLQLGSLMTDTFLQHHNDVSAREEKLERRLKQEKDNVAA